jgi:DNA-binding transcriptional ArsR family regulator
LVGVAIAGWISAVAEDADDHFAILRNTLRMPSKPSLPTPDAVFKALGNPARLTLVRKLSTGEHCVCDLVEAVGLGWSTTSKHLDVLREAGVVGSEKRGQQVFYRLELACVPDFIACLDGMKTRRRVARPACECA